MAVSEHVEIDIGDPAVVERLSKSVAPCSAIVHAAATLTHDPDAPTVSFTNCWGSPSHARRWSCMERGELRLSELDRCDRATCRASDNRGSSGGPSIRLSRVQAFWRAPRAHRPVGRHGRGLPPPYRPGGGWHAPWTDSLCLRGEGSSGEAPDRSGQGDAASELRGCPGHGNRRRSYSSVQAYRYSQYRWISSVSNVELARTCVEVLHSSSEIHFNGEDSERVRMGCIDERAPPRASDTRLATALRTHLYRLGDMAVMRVCSCQ